MLYTHDGTFQCAFNAAKCWKMHRRASHAILLHRFWNISAIYYLILNGFYHNDGNLLNFYFICVSKNWMSYISKWHRCDENRWRIWNHPIMTREVATLLQFSRRYLRWSTMLYDASRSWKSQDAGQFHRIVWQGLIANDSKVTKVYHDIAALSANKATEYHSCCLPLSFPGIGFKLGDEPS